MKYVYTAIFTTEDGGGGMMSARFPDLPGCHTCGDDLGDAIRMAGDVLCLCLYDMEQDGKAAPPATSPQSIATKGGEFITAVSVDTDDYRRYYENKSVKKTLTIPTWLNQKAEAANVNFSQTLQKALKEALELSAVE